jgi:hypothetical protein
MRLTIYDIKRRVVAKGGHYFDRHAMKFFGQTLKSFHVFKVDSDTYCGIARIRNAGQNTNFYSKFTYKVSTDTFTTQVI